MKKGPLGKARSRRR